MARKRTDADTTGREALGERIAALRADAGMSRRELGRRLDVTDVTLIRWEKGTPPPFDLAVLLVAELGVSLETLAGSAPPPRPKMPARLTIAGTTYQRVPAKV